MKYITEIELRQQYKEESFSEIVIPNDARLTPGAYQFLVDRRIRIVSTEESHGSPSSNIYANEKKQVPKEANILASDDFLVLQLEKLENTLFQVQMEAHQAMHKELVKSLQCMKDSTQLIRKAMSGDESVLSLMAMASEGISFTQTAFSITQFDSRDVIAPWIARLNRLRLAYKELGMQLPKHFLYQEECKNFLVCCALKVEHMIEHIGGAE